MFQVQSSRFVHRFVTWNLELGTLNVIRRRRHDDDGQQWQQRNQYGDGGDG
jgi:hypothetical protein